METESFNLAIVWGTCSSAPDVRIMASDDRLGQLQLTTRVNGKAMSVPVSVTNPPIWFEKLVAGDEVVVLGAVRRRFFRAAGTTASRVEIEADVVCKGRDRRRSKALRRRIDDLLVALDA
jgi:hypothetical protein